MEQVAKEGIVHKKGVRAKCRRLIHHIQQAMLALTLNPQLQIQTHGDQQHLCRRALLYSSLKRSRTCSLITVMGR